MFNYITNLKFEKKWLILLFFSLKCYWYFAEYSIQTDNAMRMQFGIQWAIGNFHPSHLDWAPLTSAYYAIVYSLSQKYFLFGDLFLILVVVIWEASIIIRIAKQFFAPNMQFWAIVSMIFYTGHAFTYQTNDIVVVWVFMEIVLALLNKQSRVVFIWMLLIPLIKYSAIAIVYLPIFYETWRTKTYKINKTKLVFISGAIISTLVYVGLTSYSGFANSATGLYFNQLVLLFRFDHFWLKYGVSEYFFRAAINSLNEICLIVLDIQLITLICSSVAFLSMLVYVLSLRRGDMFKRNEKLVQIIITITLLHIFYMVVLLVLIPLEQLPSQWTIGPNIYETVLLENSRYHNFLSLIYFIVFIKLCSAISFRFAKLNAVFLTLIFLVSFKFSGNLFAFYNEIFIRKYKSLGVEVSAFESNSYGPRNYEAWKIYYVLKQKNPVDRFK